MHPTITFQNNNLLGFGFFFDMMYPEAKNPMMTPKIMIGPKTEFELM
jgi:hypothetical protein